jgi:hypothetical protein
MVGAIYEWASLLGNNASLLGSNASLLGSNASILDNASYKVTPYKLK